MFNRFWRADPSRARTSGGTGLGLSISLEDARLHGGWLQAWGAPGRRLAVPADPAPPGRARGSPAARSRWCRATRPAPPVADAGERPAEPRRSRRCVCRAAPCCARRLRLAARPAAPSQEAGRRGPERLAAPFDFNPPGPQPGAAPDEIVTGFLDALQATPVSTRVAAGVPHARGRRAWRPDRRTIVYGSQTAADHAAPGRRAALPTPSQLDATRPLGRQRTATARQRRVRFRLDPGRTASGGSQDPPDAMVVPRPHFETRYREYSLYFFDPTGSVLVPEPVYLPAGRAGTHPAGRRAARRARAAAPARSSARTFPRGTELEVSVPGPPERRRARCR